MIDNSLFWQWYSGLTLCVRIALKIPVPVPTTHQYPPHTPDPDRAFLSRNPLKGLTLAPDWIGQVPRPRFPQQFQSLSHLSGNPSRFLSFVTSFSPIIPPPGTKGGWVSTIWFQPPIQNCNHIMSFSSSQSRNPQVGRDGFIQIHKTLHKLSSNVDIKSCHSWIKICLFGLYSLCLGMLIEYTMGICAMQFYSLMFKTNMQPHKDLDIFVWPFLHPWLWLASRLKCQFLEKPKVMPYPATWAHLWV